MGVKMPGLLRNILSGSRSRVTTRQSTLVLHLVPVALLASRYGCTVLMHAVPVVLRDECLLQ